MEDLVLVGPEGADGQLHLVPLLALRARRVPDGNAKGAAVDAHVRPQRPRAVAVAAVQEVAELDAVGVVLAHGLKQELSPVARCVLGGVHQHVGTWREGEREGEREGDRGGATSQSSGVTQATICVATNQIPPVRFA